MASVDFTEQDANDLAEAIEAYGEYPHPLDAPKVERLKVLLERMNSALDA